MTEHLNRIRAEARRIRNGCLWAAERQYAAETPWFYSNYILGIITTVLAAIAGALSFLQWPHGRYLIGGIALAVTVLSAIVTFLDPTKKATTYHNAAKAYEALYHKSGFFYRVETRGEEVDVGALQAKLSTFHDQYNDLNQASLALSARAYRVAKKKIRMRTTEVVRAPEDVEDDNAEKCTNTSNSR